jgi:Mrp family chromosome partitioning ATPase/predicted Fe-Mo cluster-binding NifX family protein
MNAEGRQGGFQIEKSPAENNILVLSGKGGVGKSTVAANLALSLSLQGRRTGLLDADFHGPSIPKMLGLEGKRLAMEDDRILPVSLGELKVISVDFMLEQRTDPVIWRGPMKMNVIKQLLEDVAWGDLEYLVIDSPPGTGDEPLSVAQLVPEPTGALIVTTPQEVSTSDVRRSISFCRAVNLPVLGVVENMAGLVCPHCGETIDLFGEGGGERMSEEMGVPFLGRIPIDPAIVKSGDTGKPFAYWDSDSPSGSAFTGLVERLTGTVESGGSPDAPPEPPADEPTGESITVAFPTESGKVCPHFGHCREFVFLTADQGSAEVRERKVLEPPRHEPGVLPRWVGEQGADLVISGGMGRKARDLFEKRGVRVVTGAPERTPEELVRDYLEGRLETGPNACSH